MPYGPTSPLGGTRIFYSSIYTLGLWTLFYSGLNGFTNSNIRISWSLPPGGPLSTDDRLLHQEIPKILYSVLSRPCVIAFCIPYHCYILRDNRIHLPVLRSTPLILLIQDASNCSCYSDNPLSLPPCISCPMNTPTDNFPTLIEYPLNPSWFMYFRKVFEILFDLPKVLSSLLPLKFSLVALWLIP